MNLQSHTIGVCSWSLRPKDMAELVSAVQSLGLSHMQLALAPLVTLDDKRKHHELGHLRQSGIKLTSTMINFADEDYSTIAKIHQTGGYLPDAMWPVRRQLTIAMAKLSLLPAVRKADTGALVVADGTSCRHQIADGANRQAVHVAQVLDRALK